MTPSSLPPSHICPKCHEGFDETHFITKTGKRARWCEDCRREHRERLINLRQKREVIQQGFAHAAAPIIAEQEGYENHPLATMLALSHLVGMHRALAIRDGKSWRGKKAWREYYQAKRELEKQLAGGEHEHGILIPCMPGCPRHPKRDNNSNSVSSK